MELLQQGDHGKQSKQQDEETYEREYPRMGRDFVHVGDLRVWIAKVQTLLTPLGIILPPLGIDKAISRGLEYKKVIEEGQDGSKIFKNIVEIF